MTRRRDKLRMLAICLCLVAGVGCRNPPRKNGEFQTLLQTVSYDSSAPAVPIGEPNLPSPAPPTASNASPKFDPLWGVRKVGVGITMVGCLMVCGVIKVVESALGIDEEYDSTPRGAADRDLNQWVNTRDQWLKSH